jgi:2-haloacid dehalogenase
MEGTRSALAFDAVLFDLLSALLDSWSLWDRIAGGEEAGRRWRMRYLEITYAEGTYRDYLELVDEAARDSGAGDDAAARLERDWDTLQPWPEANEIVGTLVRRMPVGVVTNCSIELGRRAAARLDVSWTSVITAEDSGWYKPSPSAYEAGLAALGTTPERTLFVAGSPFDVVGAASTGMRVYLHDRLGLASGDVRAAASVVHDTLHLLPAIVAGGA